ncbi:MAG: DUF485 domain-containing protein [Dehalococcoidia bacterium]|jgi:uncharacterized membrane protein (DUF485 family)
MKNGPSGKSKSEDTRSFKTKLGLIMFAIYTPIYFAFIIICVVNPQFMARDVGSLNVAVTYGFGLIILAIIQALIYNRICSGREKGEDGAEDSKGGLE